MYFKTQYKKSFCIIFFPNLMLNSNVRKKYIVNFFSAKIQKRIKTNQACIYASLF